MATRKNVKGLRKLWRKSALHMDYVRLKRLPAKGIKKLRYYAGGGKLYLDTIIVSVTTKCNLRCDGCSNLMPYYDKPYDLDPDLLLASIRKLGACLDWTDRFAVIGGEPFCNPRLKEYIAAIPREKCGSLRIVTNGTIIPKDPELYEVLRRQRATVSFSSYPSSQETQDRFIELLEQKGVQHVVTTATSWMDYGEPKSHNRSHKELTRQFHRCLIPCKIMLNGAVYYCPRSAHGFDIGLYGRGEGEYVDLMANTDAENRRQIHKLMWRHKPIVACQYCQNGTDDACGISRGK